MKTKELVFKYLNRHFKVVVDYTSTTIRCCDSGLIHNMMTIKLELIDIFGDSEQLGNILNNWFYEGERTLLKRLYDYFETLDLSKRSTRLSSQCVNNFSGDETFSSTFVTRKLEDYYIEKAEALLKNYLPNNDEETTSKDLESVLNSYLDDEDETARVSEGILEKVNKWYYDNRFESKIMDFIKDTKVDLGKRSWDVYNTKYGLIDLKNLNQFFPNENKYQQAYFREYFNQWYDDEVLKISEKIIEEF